MKVVEARAPGRVNLIGEHTDYNGGFVMPCAIRYETHVKARERADRLLTIRSHEAQAIFDLEQIPEQRCGEWRDFPRGMLLELRRAGIPLRGADVLVTADIPMGAGLSSSASFAVAFGLAVLALSGLQMEPLHFAKLAQRAEIEHVGTRCGIMDQFAALFGREGHALFLDTRSLQFEALAIPKSAAIVICNTMVKHELAAGAYNERRRECEEAVAQLRRPYPDIRDLRDATTAQIGEARFLLPGTLFDRAMHVVTENERVVQAAHALRAGDLTLLGTLMHASHESLRLQYAVSCPELDTMVSLASELPGVYGARMTGGGFGGCAVALVEGAHANEFRDRIATSYREKSGITPQIYDGTPAGGASVSYG